jgi:glucose-6-phosphate isomerase
VCWAQDLKNVHVVIVSKSGKTLETLVLADIIAKKYIERKLSLSEHFTCITEPVDQDLTCFAKKYQIASLELPIDIGGRYSVLTPVGTLILSYLNQDLHLVQQGIQKAFEAKESIRDLIAASLCSFENNCRVTALWSYSSKLKFFSAWFQQLWSESLGKPKAQVSTLLPLVGAVDQHSVLQQLIEGDFQSWSILIALDSYTHWGPVFNADEFKSLNWAHQKTIGDLINAECLATYSALNQSSRFASLFYLKDLSPESLGYILMLSQIWVAGLGFALKINPFDQPGVELGKRLIKSLV